MLLLPQTCDLQIYCRLSFWVTQRSVNTLLLIHVWGHMPPNLLHADPWSCWTSSARPLPALIEHTDVMLQPLYCHHTNASGDNVTRPQANQNGFQFQIFFCRKCKLYYKSSLMKNPSKMIPFHLSSSSFGDISNCTKLLIFAQFRPLSKTEF